MRGLKLVSFSLLVFAATLIAGINAASAATPDQIHACRNRVMEQYPGTPEFNVGVTEAWTANGSVRLDWYNGPGRTGTCVVGPKNQMFQFIINGQSQPPYNPGGNGGSGQSLQSFGDIPHVGRFDAVNNSGRFENGIVLFQAYVNGTGPSQWGARCADGRLFGGGGGNEVRDSAQARYVVAYVCNGGPPAISENGLVNFGKVPNVGQFSVVNGSGQGGNGVVYFQAFVNGAGPQNWMTACGTGQLGQNGNYVPYSPQSQYVSSYICNGGPPGGRWSR